MNIVSELQKKHEILKLIWKDKTLTWDDPNELWIVVESKNQGIRLVISSIYFATAYNYLVNDNK